MHADGVDMHRVCGRPLQRIDDEVGAAGTHEQPTLCGGEADDRGGGGHVLYEWPPIMQPPCSE